MKKISNTLIIALAASCKGRFNVARSKVGHISILQISFVLEAPEPANVREIDQNEIFKKDIRRQGVYTSHFGVRTFFQCETTVLRRPVTRILCGGVLTRPKWTKLSKCIFYLILFNWRPVNF